MNSPPGPKEHDAEEEPGLSLDMDQVLEMLDSQAAGIHEEVQSVAEAYEAEGELPRDEVNSIRTEVMEFQSNVENYLAATCEGTEPWEHASELIPRDRLDALRARA